MVGSRSIRPSTSPRLENSLMKSSDDNLASPYAPSGVAMVSGVMISGYMEQVLAELMVKARKKTY